MELHALAKLEGPDGGVVVGRPGGGKGRDEVGAAGGEVDEAFGDLPADDERVAVLRIGGVQRGREARRPVHEGLRVHHPESQEESGNN